MDFNTENKYGILLTPDIKLHRIYFDEMVRLLGIYTIYRAPRPGRTYTIYSEIETNYQEPELIGCIFEEHPDEKSLRKRGWVTELQENASMIHVPYDTHDLQKGALFIIPSGLDNAKGRLFRVNTLQNIAVYPASIACEIVPEYIDIMPNHKINEFKYSNFNVLAEEHD